MTNRAHIVEPVVLSRQTLTVEEAAIVVGCGRRTLSKAIHAGVGPRVFRTGKRGWTRIYRPHLEAWMAAGGAEAMRAAEQAEPSELDELLAGVPDEEDVPAFIERAGPPAA